MSDNIYLVGIGGIGMSALAKTALEIGMQVDGSDMAPSETTDFLQSLGARIHFNQGTAALPKDATLVVSTATRDLKEVRRAQGLGMKVLHRSEFLSELMEGTDQLLVAGTHGKTSTSALLVSVFEAAGLDPSFCIGGIHKGLGTNGRKGSGSFFIAEADESDGSFLAYRGKGAIITNIDDDHLDHFGSLQKMQTAFTAFFERIESKEHIFWCYDSKPLREVAGPGYSYGFEDGADLKIENLILEKDRLFFDLTFKKRTYRNIELKGMGRHNALNAAAVFGLALSCGIDEEMVRSAFKEFLGTRRRLERRFSGHEIDLFDDYAHHPTAVSAVLSAIREAFPQKRLVAAFQPHRYSRLKSGLADFAKALESADSVLVTPVYAAGEADVWGADDSDLIDAINEIRPRAARGVRLDQLASSLIDELRPHDLLITLGAGNITDVQAILSEHYKTHAPHKLRIGCIYGGLSSEHQVSTWSWENIESALDKRLYHLEHFYIDTHGTWSRADGEVFSFDALGALDIALPILHGPGGEDGTIQGLFHMLGVPVAGCGVMASALAMDKDLMRLVVQSLGFQTVPTLALWRWEWQADRREVCARIEKRFGLPCFAKPVSLGSTYGVVRIANREELEKGLDQLFELDEKLAVEPVMEGRELEFALVGSGAHIQALPPGEVFSQGEIYAFDSKYSSSGPVTTDPSAHVELATRLKGQEIAKAIFQRVGGSGMARLDFFYNSKRQEYFFNEMNPIPGFTEWSLYPKMLKAAGIELEVFLSHLVAEARAKGAAMRRQTARYKV